MTNAAISSGDSASAIASDTAVPSSSGLSIFLNISSTASSAVVCVSSGILTSGIVSFGRSSGSGTSTGFVSISGVETGVGSRSGIETVVFSIGSVSTGGAITSGSVVVVVVLLVVVMGLYFRTTERRLGVPPHGSPKTPLSAEIVAEFFPINAA